MKCPFKGTIVRALPNGCAIAISDGGNDIIVDADGVQYGYSNSKKGYRVCSRDEYEKAVSEKALFAEMNAFAGTYKECKSQLSGLNIHDPNHRSKSLDLMFDMAMAISEINKIEERARNENS